MPTLPSPGSCLTLPLPWLLDFCSREKCAPNPGPAIPPSLLQVVWMRVTHPPATLRAWCCFRKVGESRLPKQEWRARLAAFQEGCWTHLLLAVRRSDSHTDARTHPHTNLACMRCYLVSMLCIILFSAMIAVAADEVA